MNLDHYPSLRSVGEQFDAIADRDAARVRRFRLTLAPAPNALRLALAAACVVAAVAVGAAVTFHGGDPKLSLAQRAYAEASDVGIAHWRVTIEAYDDGVLTTTQHEEGWARGDTTHTVLTGRQGDGAVTVTERRVAGGRETYRNGDGAVQEGPAGTTDLQRALPGADPFSAYRAAYETGRLKQVGADRFVATPASPGGSTVLTYEIDPADAQPKTLTVAPADGRSRVIVRFTAYEHLPDDAAHQKLLDLGS